MTTEKERYEYVAVDPRLAKAIERKGVTGFQNLLLELAGTQELDEPTKKGLFWQLIGWMAAEAGRAAAKPWQLLSLFSLSALFVVIAWVWNFMFLMALGVVP
jgi:hypothetical protein